MLAPHLTEQLVAALAEELVPRLALELAAQLPPLPAAEPWHLLDLEQAAERLGRSTRWVRERAKRGDLPFVRLDGGRLAFELDDLREFARDRRIPLARRLQANGNGAPNGFGDPSSAWESEGSARRRPPTGHLLV
jgi:excisionase family DNA binding protein